uniref:Nonsense-mediated mRNA decay factor SMG8 n=1 Tax=Peronospora matthiolae TaxID=2874970 RepID=A0AAV1UEN5_9STRA
MAKPPPLPPPSSSSSSPPAPPLPFDRSQNEPVRIYPPESGRRSSLAALQSLQNRNVAVLGFLSTSSSSPSRAFAFANRVIGRYVFRDEEMAISTTVKNERLPATIHLFYDDEARCIYLLGVSRPASLSFRPRRTTTLNSSKNKPLLGHRPKTAERDAIEQTQVKEGQRIRAEVRAFEHEKLKMQALLYSSCHMLIVMNETARMTTNALKEVRALAAEKSQLLSLVPTTTKHSKRTSGHVKGPSSGTAGNAFAPGRCVPLVVHVVPAPDAILSASIKTQGSGSSRSATVSYCKALEARLTALFRSLRGSTVGSLRMRDALSVANLSKERRVFNLDPTHCVVVVSQRTATADGRAEAQLGNLLDVLDSGISVDDILKDVSLLQPLADDDMGFQQLNQYVQKYLHLLFSFSSSGNKDSCGRTELLSPLQWVKAFHGLVKGYIRMDSKRLQEAAALEATESREVTNYKTSPLLAPY